MSSISEYLEELHSLMMFCMDCTRGFYLLSKDIENIQRKNIQIFKKKNPKIANVDYLDSVSFTYGRGRPDDPNALILAEFSQGDLKKRNSKNGENTNLVAFSVITMAYSLWEDKYREEITKYLELKEPIKIDSIGDLRNFRHDILHNKGVCSKKNSFRNKVFKWFKFGNELKFTEEMITDILLGVRKDLQEVYFEKMGKKLESSKFLTKVGPGHSVI